VVLLSEGNRARRDGREGVGVPHTTCEAGELALGDPVEGRGYRGYGTAGGKDGGNVESHNRLNGTPADSETGARR
jgi:hypothetical protein